MSSIIVWYMLSQPHCPSRTRHLKVFLIFPCRHADSACKGRRGIEAALLSEAAPSWARVKSLLVQSAAALWIGTRGGHLLLVELFKHQTLQVIAPRCDSIRCITSALIGGSSCASCFIISRTQVDIYSQKLNGPWNLEHLVV